jgi:hypothetical protein
MSRKARASKKAAHGDTGCSNYYSHSVMLLEGVLEERLAQVCFDSVCACHAEGCHCLLHHSSPTRIMWLRRCTHTLSGRLCANACS